MVKKDLGKVATTSEPVLTESLMKLREVFPQFVKDGQVDFAALQAFFDKEGITAGPEKYGLSWAGKSRALQALRAPATGTLTPQEKESKDWDKTQNVFIEGDNLEVLKLLQAQYRGAIKMIYIDPPYNTGKDFVYKDNFTEGVSDYYERTGQSKDGIKLTANLESNGRYHSDWLTMMYPRLFLAKNLLKDDGVIFISIDDNEVANLRLIMDEIFGEENFVATIVWQKKYAASNDANGIPAMHDYIVAFQRSNTFERKLFPRTEKQDALYKNDDGDGRGLWRSDNLLVKTFSENAVFPIINPKTGERFLPKKGNSWRASRETVGKWIEEGRIFFGRNGKSAPQLKRYLNEVQQGVIPVTWWPFEDAGHNNQANKELQELFGAGRVPFDTPKPTKLIQRLLQLGTEKNEDDVALDFFAGSGTTAHAVMAQNADDGGNRKWICVQLPEATEKDSEAYKAGYKNIAEIALERIRRAGEKIGKGDIGFKAFALEQSNYRRWNVITDADDEKKLLAQEKLFAEKPLVDKYEEKAVVYEILLKEGFSLNAEVSQDKRGTLKPWIITDGERKLVVTFVEKVSKDQVDALKMSENDLLVCLDSALDDSTKVNISRNLNVKVI